MKAARAAASAAWLVLFAAGPAVAVELLGGFLALRVRQQAAVRKQQLLPGEVLYSYLPPQPVLPRATVLAIPSEPTVAPLEDRLILTPDSTPPPPLDANGVAIVLPPRGLEGWYATLPPRAGLPAGAVDWDRYYLRCLGGPPPCPYTYPTTTGLPLGAPSPAGAAAAAQAAILASPPPPGMQTVIAFTLLVQNLDYAALTADATALSQFQISVKLAVASQAGLGITPADVQLMLFAGSVVTQVHVVPPQGADITGVLAHLQAATMLANTAATLLAATPSVAGLFSGAVTIDVSKVPELAQVPMAAAPAPAPSPAS